MGTHALLCGAHACRVRGADGATVAVCTCLHAPVRTPRPTKTQLQEWLRWIGRSLNPFPPPGLRHRAMPLSEAMARARVMVATAWAVTGEEKPSPGCGVFAV